MICYNIGKGELHYGLRLLKIQKILIVDDEADLREMVTSILAQDGFKTIRTAGTVAEALKICRDWEPDLAILDVMLPDGDGFSLFEQMRTFTEVPVLFNCPWKMRTS